MLEKIGKITNPLTIIAIFAGISEVSGSIVLPFIEKENQLIFIYYLIAFPVLLVVSFFITLHLKNSVLYAPSDFKDEKNFFRIKGFDYQKNSDVERTFNQSEIIAEYSKKIELLSRNMEDVQITLAKQSIKAFKCKILVSNFYDVTEFLIMLKQKGYLVEIYHSILIGNDIADYAEHKAIWLGKNVQLEIASEVISISKKFYDHLEYIQIVGNEGDSEDIENEIYIGGSTSTAKRESLKPLSKHDFELIKEKGTLVELHKFICSFHS